MTNPRYQDGCSAEFKEHGKTSARWVVDFNNGNVNDNHRNNNACVRAVRASECRGEQDVSFRELYKAFKNARKGKKPSSNQLCFERDWGSKLLQLQRNINHSIWKPSQSSCFVAAKPKAREIHAPDFSDRVVHHWLVPQLEAIWEPAFIFDSYANRKGKGGHEAVNRLKQFVRQVDSGQCGGWYLQLDIHNFFNSIHRPTLWCILKKKLLKVGVSNQVLNTTHALLRKSPQSAGVIHHSSSEERAAVPIHKRLENAAAGCGLPIGNLSSQFFANVYLDKLDQFVKHTLKAKRYLRYVDDFVIVHKDRQQLAEWQAEIEKFIATALRLKLKPDIKLRPLSDGIDFLGYVVRPSHTLVRRRVVSHFKDALFRWGNKHVKDGNISATPEQLRSIKSVVASYQGHISHAKSQRLKMKLDKQFPWLESVLTKRNFDYRLEDEIVQINLGLLS